MTASAECARQASVDHLVTLVPRALPDLLVHLETRRSLANPEAMDRPADRAMLASLERQESRASRDHPDAMASKALKANLERQVLTAPLVQRDPTARQEIKATRDHRVQMDPLVHPAQRDKRVNQVSPEDPDPKAHLARTQATARALSAAPKKELRRRQRQRKRPRPSRPPPPLHRRIRQPPACESAHRENISSLAR